MRSTTKFHAEENDLVENRWSDKLGEKEQDFVRILRSLAYAAGRKEMGSNMVLRACRCPLLIYLNFSSFIEI